MSEHHYALSIFYAASAVFPFTGFFSSNTNTSFPQFQWSTTTLKSMHVQRPRGSNCPQGSSHNEWLSWQSSASSEGFLHKSGHSHHSLGQVNKWCSREGIEESGGGGGFSPLVNSVLFHSLSTVRLSWCWDWGGAVIRGELDRRACSGSSQRLVIGLWTGRAGRETDN